MAACRLFGSLHISFDPVADQFIRAAHVTYSNIKQLIRQGDVVEATLSTNAIVAVLRNSVDENVRVRAIIPQQPDPDLLASLEQADVIITAEAPAAPSILI